MIQILEEVDADEIVALDESSILLMTPVKKVVAKKGEKPILKIEKRYKGITIIGAITGTGELIYQIQESKADKESFEQFIVYLHHSCKYRAIHVILDNARYHLNREVKEKAKRMKMSLHFQPTHSPFVNAAEEIWRQLRQFLRGRLFYSLDRLKKAIHEFFIINPFLNVKLARYLD